jgi:hypothetical protein
MDVPCVIGYRRPLEGVVASGIARFRDLHTSSRRSTASRATPAASSSACLPTCRCVRAAYRRPTCSTTSHRATIACRQRASTRGVRVERPDVERRGHLSNRLHPQLRASARRRLPACRLYVRVSTKEQTENLSLPTHLRACEEYCRQSYEILECSTKKATRFGRNRTGL